VPQLYDAALPSAALEVGQIDIENGGAEP